MSEDDKGTAIIVGIMFGGFALIMVALSFMSAIEKRACYEALAAGANVVCDDAD